MCCFHKDYFCAAAWKWAWRADKVLFFVSAGLWVYPSPLSVAKLHPCMSYHRHICTKYAMKLCDSCTIGAICPSPTFVVFPLAVRWGSMSVRQLYPVGCLSLPLARFSYLCQLVTTVTRAQQFMTLSLKKTKHLFFKDFLLSLVKIFFQFLCQSLFQIFSFT